MNDRIRRYGLAALAALLLLAGLRAITQAHPARLEPGAGGSAGAPGLGPPTCLATVGSRTPTPTVTGTPPTDTPTATAPPTAYACARYQITPVPGATFTNGLCDVGNHCDDCTTTINLPFPYTLYDVTFLAAPAGHGYTTMEIGANGTLKCPISALAAFFPDPNVCLPAAGFDYTIFAHWDDLRTDCGGCGVFTAVTGSFPSRIFTIEWRAIYYGTAIPVNVAVLLYEDPTPYLARFDVVYRQVPQLGNGATVGVQRDFAGNRYTQWSCNTPSLQPNYGLVFVLAACPTPTPCPTCSPTPTTTGSPTPTLPPSATRTATVTAPPVATSTATRTPTRTPTPPVAASGTPTPLPSATRTPSASPTPSATRTPAAPPSATGTPAGSATATPTSGPPPATLTPPVPPSPTPTSTPCPVQFSDVPASDPFYPYIRCLACRGIVSGYADGTFRPSGDVTRGQLTKIIARAAGIPDPIPSARQTFADVPPGQPFWLWIEQLAGRGVISGYACGGPGEPCDGQNRPYFRPGNSATRGQIAKIDALAAQIPDPVPTSRQTFEDVPPGNPFWLWIEQLAGRGVISGYTCGGPGEPCYPPGNRAYFRWGANTTRGQMAKIAANTFFPGCQTPARP